MRLAVMLFKYSCILLVGLVYSKARFGLAYSRALKLFWCIHGIFAYHILAFVNNCLYDVSGSLPLLNIRPNITVSSDSFEYQTK